MVGRSMDLRLYTFAKLKGAPVLYIFSFLLFIGAEMTKFKNKVFIITGASRQRGIGRATALRLAQEGADLVISAIRREASSHPAHERELGWLGIHSLAEEIEALGRRCLAVDCDVTHPKDIEVMVERSLAEFGRIDGVVNNAGVAGGAGAEPIIETEDADWHRTLSVNLSGVYLVSKYVARAMVKGGQEGAIVNLASLAGRMGMANYGAYCASKFGVIGLTQQMAHELARYGIRVNCICPGSVDTDMMDGTIARTADRVDSASALVKANIARGIPMRRQGIPAEQASAISFLLGPDSAYITGQTLNVDGGVRMD